MKSPLASRFSRRSRAARLAVSALALTSAVQSASAITYTYAGGTTGVWSTPTVWNPNGVPGANDTAAFTGAAAQQVLLGTNANDFQSALGLSFTATAGTSSVRGGAAGQFLLLGTGGIQYGSTQTDLGGGNTSAMAISLQGSQSWTGVGSGLIQFNAGNAAAQSITNGTAGAVNLTFDGAGIGTRTIGGVIDDGVFGGTTAITFTGTGTAFGALVLNANNTYSGGTNFNQGYQLQLNNGGALGTGPLNIGGAALNSGSGTVVIRPIVTTVVGGVTLTNNNPQNWNADFSLSGTQNINFGTGAVTLGGNRTIVQNPGGNAVTYTEGGNISGAFSLASTTLNLGSTVYTPGINSTLVLSGTNSYTGGTNINAGLVNFTSAAAVPTTGLIVVNGGALAVGPGTAFATLADVAANPNVSRLSGSLALTADSAENFTAPNAAISVGAALGSVVRYTGTITTSGNNYNLGGGGGTIVFSNNNAFTGAKSITTNGGTQSNTAGGGGTVIITGQNDATGNGGTGVNIGLGTLQVSSINSVVGGTATSNLGAPTVAANGTINIGTSGSFSQLRYTGLGETTDRNLNNGGFSGSSTGIDASGTGPVVFTGAFSQVANSVNNRSFTLRGINTGANTITAGIGTQAVNPGSLNLTKQQRGNWTLTGTNNFAGNAAAAAGIQINGGTLTADYSTNPNVLGATATNLTLGGGTLAIVGSAAGGTTQSIGNAATPLITLTANTGQNNINVTGNGTAGSAILTTGTNFTRNAGTFLNFNLLNGGQVATATTALTNSVLVGTGTPLAAFTVTNAAGTDFATVAGGQIAKLGATTALPASGASSTTNYVLAGSQTLTATDTVNSLRIDTSAGGGTLALGAFNITPTTGVILKDGANPYTISGTSIGAANAAVVLSTFGAGSLTVSSAVTTGTGSLTKTGNSLVDLTGANVYTGATNIFGGVLRASNASFGTGNIVLNTGGILEIGADLNGATAGDFSRQVGTGGSQIQWANGDGGFSAFGANRVVNLTNNLGAAGGQLVWGSTNGNNFVTAPNASPAFVKDGFALLLSSSTSDSTIELQNAIDFVNLPRAVVVGNGTATVDAVLSGVLSSSDFSGGLEKSGAGTLAITGANTYTGETRILAGTLQVGNGGTAGTLGNGGAVINNAALVFNRSGTTAVAVSNVISGTGTLTQAGTGITSLTGNNTYTGATTVNLGTLRVNNTPVAGVGSATGLSAVAVNGTSSTVFGTLGGGNGAANGGTLNSLVGGATSRNYGAGILGVVSGAVTINQFGHLAPGNSVGTLTVQSLTLASGAVLDYEFTLAGTANDLTAVSGLLTLGASTLNLFQENTTSAFTVAGTYNLFSYGALAGSPASIIVANQQAGYNYSITNNAAAGLIQLTIIAPVPEPSTYVMLGLGLGGLGLAVARRRRRVLAA